MTTLKIGSARSPIFHSKLSKEPDLLHQVQSEICQPNSVGPILGSKICKQQVLIYLHRLKASAPTRPNALNMPIQNFETPFKNYVEGTQQILNKIDIATLAPDATPFEKEIRQNLSRATLLTQEATAKNVESLTSDLLKYFTIKDNIPNPADPAGGNFTIDEIKQEIENKASKTIGSIRVAQMGVYEGLQLHTAEFEPLTPLLNPLPAFGATEAVSPSDLKAIDTFMGDGSIETESDNLRLFLRAIYDVCRGKITENGCKNAILRKLSGTALSLVDRLTDSYRDTDGNIPPNKPSLHEIAHFLERRFLIDSTPEIANARLNSLRQLPNETYTSLEGRIAKLARQASLG